MRMQSVRSKDSFFLAIKYQELLAINVSGWIENVVPVFWIDIDESCVGTLGFLERQPVESVFF